MARGKDGINSEALREQNEKVRFMHFLESVSDIDEKIDELKAEARNQFLVEALERAHEQMPGHGPHDHPCLVHEVIAASRAARGPRP